MAVNFERSHGYSLPTFEVNQASSYNNHPSGNAYRSTKPPAKEVQQPSLKADKMKCWHCQGDHLKKDCPTTMCFWKKTQPTSNKTHGTSLQELQVQTLLPVFPVQSSFQTYAHNDNKPPIKLQDADIPHLVQSKLNKMLNDEFACIISKSSTDLGRKIDWKWTYPLPVSQLHQNLIPYH